jgi:hypothetical protein
MTPLMLASCFGKLRLVRLLIKHGAHVIRPSEWFMRDEGQYVDEYGNEKKPKEAKIVTRHTIYKSDNAFTLAIKRQQTWVVQELLRHRGIDIEAFLLPAPHSMLDLAIMSGSDECMQLMASVGTRIPKNFKHMEVGYRYREEAIRKILSRGVRTRNAIMNFIPKIMYDVTPLYEDLINLILLYLYVFPEKSSSLEQKGLTTDVTTEDEQIEQAGSSSMFSDDDDDDDAEEV